MIAAISISSAYSEIATIPDTKSGACRRAVADRCDEQGYTLTALLGASPWGFRLPQYMPRLVRRWAFVPEKLR